MPTDIFLSDIDLNEKNKLSLILKIINQRTQCKFTEKEYENWQKEIQLTQLNNCDFFQDKEIKRKVNEFNELYQKEMLPKEANSVIFDERLFILDIYREEKATPRKLSFFVPSKGQIKCSKKLDFYSKNRSWPL